MRKNYYYDFIYSNIGFVSLVVSDKGVVMTSAPEKSLEKSLIKIKDFNNKLFKNEEKTFMYKNKLELYFKGKDINFEDIYLDLLIGTEFQKKVWNICRKIKFGEVKSYKWISEMIESKPYAYRAVGNALRLNPVPIFVPCHRVIGTNGKLCGYNSLQGISVKKKLINLEKYYKDSLINE